MPFIIGTDEAGYGPNLGPLVIGGTLWHVPGDVFDLFEHLREVIAPPGRRTQTASAEKIVIGDSKALYKSRGSMAALERSVLTMLGVATQIPSTLYELFSNVAGQTALQLADETTYRWNQVQVPFECKVDELEPMVKRVRQHLDTSQVSCCKMAATVLFPGEFNQGLGDFGNKASLLSVATCRLVRRLLESHDDNTDEDVLVLCDKHGGRGYYGSLIQQEMTESFVQVIHESREESRYQWNDSGKHFEMRFMPKGEKHLPIALASMIAKYLRELSMHAWNRFWVEEIPELQPTAGYPQDAKRFKLEIQSAQNRLEVTDHLIWRCK